MTHPMAPAVPREGNTRAGRAPRTYLETLMNTEPTTGPACGNNPNVRLTDGDRQAVAEFRAYLADRAALLEQIADVLAEADGWTWAPGFDRRRSPAYQAYLTRADRVVGLLAAHDTTRADARVRALHQQYTFGTDPQDYCAHCNQISGGWIPWPCPTVQALDAAGAQQPEPETARTADGATALRDAADFFERVLEQSLDLDNDPRYCTAVRDVVMGLRRRADETQQDAPCGRPGALPGPCSAGGHCCQPQQAGAQQQPTTETAAPAEDPARIDRLRPEFTEHSSIEAIDAQLQRARAQQRRWHLRAEWLISLRADRVARMERGEWPADEPAPVSPVEAAERGEQQAATPTPPVHACPGPDDNGVSRCCGRRPYDFRGEHLTRDPGKVTCKGARP